MPVVNDPSLSTRALSGGRWIGLVGPEVEENLSLRYLAGSLERAGYRARILPFNGERDFPRISGSRGCYGHCRYCCIAAWHEANGEGRRYRLRGVEEVADEMARQQRARGVEIFVFQDDNFFLPQTIRIVAARFEDGV